MICIMYGSFSTIWVHAYYHALAEALAAITLSTAIEQDLVLDNLSLTEFCSLLQKATSTAFLLKSFNFNDSISNSLPIESSSGQYLHKIPTTGVTTSKTNVFVLDAAPIESS